MKTCGWHGPRWPGRLTSLAVRVLCALALLVLPGPATGVLAQGAQAALPDLRSIVPGAGEMPGFALDAGRTVLQDLPDGTVSYDAVYVRRAGVGPTEVRLAAARTASGRASALALASTRDALGGTGWSPRDVPLLGEEAIGFSASEAAAGGSGQAGYAYMFRFGRHLIGAVLVGPATATSLDQALGYAVQMSARLDAMLALAPVPDPDPVPAGAVVAATVPTVTASSATSSTNEGSRGRPAEQSNSVPNSSRPPVRVTSVTSDVRLENAPELENGFRLGGFSGLAAIDSSGANFFTTTDRGPNGEIKVDGKKEIAFPLPRYTPRVVKLRLDGDRLRVVDTITLKVPDGYTDPVTGTRDLTGLPAFDGSGEDAYSPDGREAYGTDPYGVDTEGIAYDQRDGSFWLADEYGPSIVHVAADGTLLMRITPRGLGLATPGVAVRELLPGSFRMRKPNRGFEGISISPDGTRVFAMLQSPLLNPDKKSGEASRHIRIAVLDTSNGDDPSLLGVYVYQAQKASEVGAAEQDEIKIGDIAAISRTRILVGERDSVEGGKHKKVYLVDLANATNIAERDEINGKTIEQATETDLRKANIDYVRKTVAVDLAKLGFSPDKFEGLAYIDPTTIAVVNDNDFGVSAIDSRGRVVKSGSPPRLVVIRVPEPLQ